MAENDNGMPMQGAQVIPVPRGAQGYGLAFAGTAGKSGGSILTTSQKKVTFNANQFLTGGSPQKKPVLIQMRARAGTLDLALGDPACVEQHAINTWTDPLPCTDLYEGKTSWYVTGSTTDVLEYRIYFV